MRISKSLVAAAVVVLGVGFGAGVVFSQDDAPKEPSPEEMMKAMEEMSRLGDEHKELAKMVGTWDADGTFYFSGQELPGKGTSTTSSLFDGRYFVDDFEMTDFMGKPFKGRGLMGYDTMKKKHWTVWVDTARTTPMVMWGTPDASGRTITYLATEPMEWEGEKYTSKSVVERQDDDHHTFTMWSVDSQGNEKKEMVMRYSRKK